MKGVRAIQRRRTVAVGPLFYALVHSLPVPYSIYFASFSRKILLLYGPKEEKFDSGSFTPYCSFHFALLSSGGPERNPIVHPFIPFYKFSRLV